MDDFAYVRPSNEATVCRLLEEHAGGATILSGGQSLLPMLRLRLAAPECLIDINDLPDRDYIIKDGDVIRIGCLTRYADIESSSTVREHCRVLADTAGAIGDRQVRNRGTLCGSVAHADPSGDPPALMRLLGGEVVATSADGDRTIDVRTFYDGLFETQLDDGEFVSEVRIPVVKPPRGAAYEKWEPSVGSYPTATCGADVVVRDGAVETARIVTGAVDGVATAMDEAADHLAGNAVSEDAIDEAAAIVERTVTPIADADGGTEFKSKLSNTLARRALRSAIERAGGGAFDG